MVFHTAQQLPGWNIYHTLNSHSLAHISLSQVSYGINIVGIEEKCSLLTHWGRMTHICVGNLTIICSDDGLLPGQRQAIIWTNAGILLIGPLGTNILESLIEILTFSFTKIRLKLSSATWQPFCLGLSVLTVWDKTKFGSQFWLPNSVSF